MAVRLVLKRVLLPIWNQGHRLAWRIGELTEAIAKGRFDRCSVCGRWGPIVYRRWVITPRLAEIGGWSPRTASAFARKESFHCAFCSARLRNRRMAEVLLDLYPIGSAKLRAKSLAQWVKTTEAQALRIAEINRVDGLHPLLIGLPKLVYSEYQDENPDPDPGIRREDLMHLSYQDASFDLVLTSETLEHIPNLTSALLEIHRILKPGGYHIFTIPRAPNIAKTFARAELGPDGEIMQHATPLYHPSGDSGYFVFTEFGDDVLEILRAAGFEPAERFGPIDEDNVAQVYVGTAQKNGRG